MSKYKPIIKDKMARFITEPYPFYYRGKTIWHIASLLFIMTLFFGFIFEPFEVYIPEHKMDYFWISLIHALTPVIVIILLSTLSRTQKTEETWTILKEILLVASFLLLVGIGQFLIRDIIYDNPNNWSWRYLYEEIRNTFLVGSLFATLLISLNFNRLNAKNKKHATALNSTNEKIKSSNHSTVFIKTQVKSDDFELDVNNMLFAKADGNYIELYLINEKDNKVVKRSTIKDLEEALKSYQSIIKTHRSYLVNLYHVKNITGNAQGYKLQLNQCNEKVPVSRSMIHSFDQRMNRI